MRNLRPLFTALMLIFMMGQLSAQTNELAPLFQTEELIQLTIKADLSAIQADRGATAEYHGAQLLYGDGTGDFDKIKIKLRVRGRYRRDELVCQFPPLKMKISKKHVVKDGPFAHQRKLKIVTHCQDEQYVLREYYLYKVYNMVADQSFQVRLAQITWKDTSGKYPDETRFAFFIEDKEMMAERMSESLVSEDVNLANDDVNRDLLTKVHLFNFMIANKDFNVKVRQNVEVITQHNDLPVVVPYDFDWSGMVDASYTKMTYNSKPSYYDRMVFQPLCRNEGEFLSAVAEFREIYPHIRELYRESPYLSKESVKESLKYYKHFFKVVQNPKKVQSLLVDSCNQGSR
ncbi:hypothetical protein [Pontibacter sp. G13]|uniref:hypothetical protein n=1 Tax=Pontibacter sp. G13 TaxID=3074898 RepID=UPI002889BE14|nr:hypothetical protein [Pontibacter sp. G13]WNJ20966.1 hypothetical protein RJD25_10860 [Pontibacter sp. G13]